jgi:hypothetical protein
MEIDDMFFVPGRTKNTLSTHATTVGKALNRKYVTRKTYMVKTKQGWEPCDPGATGATLGIGVWRTE